MFTLSRLLFLKKKQKEAAQAAFCFAHHAYLKSRPIRSLVKTLGPKYGGEGGTPSSANKLLYIDAL
jgi:hypothetical protein